MLLCAKVISGTERGIEMSLEMKLGVAQKSTLLGSDITVPCSVFTRTISAIRGFAREYFDPAGVDPISAYSEPIGGGLDALTIYRQVQQLQYYKGGKQ